MRRSLTEIQEIVLNGDVAAFPTETVYGLGALAFNPEAVAKIFCVKGRPSDNPLIVHVHHSDALNLLVESVPDHAKALIKTFWPGPLALILPKKATVPDLVTAGLPKVAVRCPDHDLALKLISITGPLAAPSANKSGRPSPTSADHVELDFGADFPVLDGGNCRVGIESTVLDLSGIKPTVLRPGSISVEMIASCIGTDVLFHTNSSENAAPASPGMKYTHYAPKAIVNWWDGNPDAEALILSLFTRSEKPHDVFYAGNVDVLTRELYDKFRLADYLGFRRVLIEPFNQSLAPVAFGLLNRIQKAIGR